MCVSVCVTVCVGGGVCVCMMCVGVVGGGGGGEPWIERPYRCPTWQQDLGPHRRSWRGVNRRSSKSSEVACHHGDAQTKNQPSVTAWLAPLSPHYIILIRPQQALLLARIYCKLFVFKYVFEI